jgi:hypothetical protein
VCPKLPTAFGHLFIVLPCFETYRLRFTSPNGEAPLTSEHSGTVAIAGAYFHTKQEFTVDSGCCFVLVYTLHAASLEIPLPTIANLSKVYDNLCNLLENWKIIRKLDNKLFVTWALAVGFNSKSIQLLKNVASRCDLAIYQVQLCYTKEGRACGWTGLEDRYNDDGDYFGGFKPAGNRHWGAEPSGAEIGAGGYHILSDIQKEKVALTGWHVISGRPMPLLEAEIDRHANIMLPSDWHEHTGIPSDEDYSSTTGFLKHEWNIKSIVLWSKVDEVEVIAKLFGWDVVRFLDQQYWPTAGSRQQFARQVISYLHPPSDNRDFSSSRLQLLNFAIHHRDGAMMMDILNRFGGVWDKDFVKRAAEVFKDDAGQLRELARCIIHPHTPLKERVDILNSLFGRGSAGVVEGVKDALFKTLHYNAQNFEGTTLYWLGKEIGIDTLQNEYVHFSALIKLRKDTNSNAEFYH